MKAKKYDVVIIGAGITGLLLHLKLLELGFKVLLIEKGEKLARSSSTKCEGILHRGLYHSYAIDDIAEAIEVSRKCIYGYEQILSKYPQVVEEYFLETVALIKDNTNAEKAMERWNKAGVDYELITSDHAIRILPEAKLDNSFSYFKAKEKSINPRLLLHLIQNQIVNVHKGDIINEVKDLKFIDKHSITIKNINGEYEVVEADFIVYAAGKGVKQIFSDEFKMDLPIKIYKAHLLVTERMFKNNLYCLDNVDVTIFNHTDASIIGMTKYNKLCNEDDIEIDEDAVEVLLNETAKYYDIKKMNINYHPYWCHKVDFGRNDKGYHSLNTQLHEPFTNHFLAMPGKLTEAPWLTDRLANEIFNRKNNSPIAERPCDVFCNK